MTRPNARCGKYEASLRRKETALRRLMLQASRLGLPVLRRETLEDVAKKIRTAVRRSSIN